MSVVVIGLEMPNACCHCPCSDSAGCAATGRVMTTEEMAGQLGDIDDCPLRPLPEKHGKLIDADAFIQQCRIEGENHTLTHDINRYKLGMGELIDLINVQPTIVEAEE